MDMHKHYGINSFNLLIDTDLDGIIKYDSTADMLQFSRAAFNFNNTVIGKFSAKITNLANPQYEGKLNVTKLMLNKLLDQFAVLKAQRQGLDILNSLSYASNFKGNLNELNLASFNFNASNLIQGSGNLQLTNFAHPQYSGYINMPVFSLNKVLPQLGIPAPDLPNKQFLNQVSLSTNFAGGVNKVNLTKLKLKVSNSNLNGDINLNLLKPLNFTENIDIDQLDVANFSNINGFKAPLHQVHLAGSVSMTGNSFASLSGKENVQIQNVTVRGISLDKLIIQLHQVISNTGDTNTDILRTLANSAQMIQVVQNMQAGVNNATKPGAKDLTQQTNLGAFSSSLSLKNGVANPSNFKLNGPSLSLNGKGTVNLRQKSLNYNINSQLLVTGINPIFKKLIFPAHLQGSFTDPQVDVDWVSVQQQILSYAITNNKEQIKNVISNQVNQLVGPQVKQTVGNKEGSQLIDSVGKATANVLGNIFGK
jgi:hypothetical protein